MCNFFPQRASTDQLASVSIKLLYFLHSKTITAQFEQEMPKLQRQLKVSRASHQSLRKKYRALNSAFFIPPEVPPVISLENSAMSKDCRETIRRKEAEFNRVHEAYIDSRAASAKVRQDIFPAQTRC